jgi:transcriptional regulator with XRE-family HTH domain
MHVGQKIKEARKTKGFSQEELAERAKINLRTVQRIETNESEPRGTTLNLICGVIYQFNYKNT